MGGMQYRLRTLLIAATIGPPVLSAAWFAREPFRLLVCVGIAGVISELILRLSMIARTENP
jgi:hypothetical protein